MSAPIWILHGCYGDVQFSAVTGEVFNPGSSEYKDIMHINVTELRKWAEQHYPNGIKHGEFDILDVGFWGSENEYYPPCEDSRKFV